MLFSYLPPPQEIDVWSDKDLERPTYLCNSMTEDHP